MQSDRLAGRTTVLSIRPTTQAGAVISWAAIASGSQDVQIRRQADQIKAFGAPVILAFHHEADIAHGFGSPAQFVAAYRHFVEEFRAERVGNVKFAVIFTPTTFASDIAAWYPGDGYVDWIAADAYNFGSCKSGVGPWRSLSAAAGAFYDWASQRDKPLMLAEFGAPNDSADPERRTQWISAAARTLSAWPDLKAALYFDAVGTCDWRLPTGSSALAAFDTFARSAAANEYPTAHLDKVIASGAAPFTLRLDGSGSTGGGQATGRGVTGYTFDAGDGTSPDPGSGKPAIIEHTYKRPGNYVGTLTIVDADGRSARASITVSVHS